LQPYYEAEYVFNFPLPSTTYTANFKASRQGSYDFSESVTFTSPDGGKMY